MPIEQPIFDADLAESRAREALYGNCWKNVRPGIWTGDETAAGVYYAARNRIRIARSTTRAVRNSRSLAADNSEPRWISGTAAKRKKKKGENVHTRRVYLYTRYTRVVLSHTRGRARVSPFSLERYPAIDRASFGLTFCR